MDWKFKKKAKFPLDWYYEGDLEKWVTDKKAGKNPSAPKPVSDPNLPKSEMPSGFKLCFGIGFHIAL